MTDLDKNTDKFKNITPPNGAYFLTQTLKPAYYALSARRQITETKNILKKILKRYSDNFFYTIEMTKSSNVHYHAWIVIRTDSTIMRLCLIDDLKILGRTDLKPITRGHEDIRNYMIKDQDTTDRLLNFTAKGKPRLPNFDIDYRFESLPKTYHVITQDIIKTYDNCIDFDDEIIFSQYNMQMK